jgi:predicted porin
MQKKLIVLALAGLTAAPAFAQSNVTVYGRVDYGYQSRGGNDGLVGVNGRKGEMASGMQGGSRLGFKGSEDLGNGLKAIFEIESGLTNDASGVPAGSGNGSNAATGNSGLFTSNRHAYVGLTGNFGTVVGGRLDGVRYGIFNKYDAFGGGGMGNFTQMTAQVDRADNAIAYISPKFSGFGVVLAHSRSIFGQETAGSINLAGAPAGAVKANNNDGRLYTAMLTYDNGPLSAAIDYERINFAHDGALENAHVITAGASYDFGMVKLSAVYDIHRADWDNTLVGPGEAVDYKDWFVSAKVPYGKFDFKATYGRVSDRRNNAETAQTSAAIAGATRGDASKIGLGVNYNLSKRTNIYADYARISNSSNANYMLSPGANSISGATTIQAGGYGVSGFNVGLAHNF